MAVVVTQDVIKRGLVHQDLKGYTATRGFTVSGIPQAGSGGGAPATASEIEYFALQQSGIPTLGSVHDVTSLNACFCWERVTRTVDSQTVEVTCNYMPLVRTNIVPSNSVALKWSVGGSTSGSNTSFDASGTLITATPPGGGTALAVSVDKDKALLTLSGERLEIGAPIASAGTYVNTINLNAVTIAGVVFAAKTLRMTRINGTPKDGSNWSTVYECTYDPLLWVASYVYVAPDGTIPDLATVNTVDVYATADWAPLNLS